jgi:CheY-like chemotaxis protein
MHTILVVDDDQNQRLLYHEELVHEGYDVIDAATAMEAISRVEEGGVDLVVLDIAMPGMDGVEALTHILDIDNKMPIVLNTAYSGYKDNFMTWAADAYVVKSSDLSTLKTKIREALEARAGESSEPSDTGG